MAQLRSDAANTLLGDITMWMMSKGMPLELVSKMLGHESVSTTQIYLDLAEDDLKSAHKKYVT